MKRIAKRRSGALAAFTCWTALTLGCSLLRSLDDLESSPSVPVGGSDAGGADAVQGGATDASGGMPEKPLAVAGNAAEAGRGGAASGGKSSLGGSEGSGGSAAPASGGTGSSLGGTGGSGQSGGFGNGGSGGVGAEGGSAGAEQGGSSGPEQGGGAGPEQGGGAGAEQGGGAGPEQGGSAGADGCAEGMTPVQLEGGVAFCIDTYEVTQREYQKYLDGPPVEMPNACPGAVPRVPAGDDGQACATPYTPEVTPDHPVACVAFCDAALYCRSVGKRLCSRNVESGNWESARQDEWYRACAGEAGWAFPYGPEFSRSPCNVHRPGEGVLPVGARTECRSDWGVFDLSGNVAEWTASCHTDSNDGIHYCITRGGSHASLSPLDLDCATEMTTRLPKAARSPFVGIRCCVD